MHQACPHSSFHVTSHQTRQAMHELMKDGDYLVYSDAGTNIVAEDTPMFDHSSVADR